MPSALILMGLPLLKNKINRKLIPKGCGIDDDGDEDANGDEDVLIKMVIMSLSMKMMKVLN